MDTIVRPNAESEVGRIEAVPSAADQRISSLFPPSPGLGVQFRNVLIGSAAGAGAVGLRYAFDLPTGVLPFFTVVIAVCMAAVIAGLSAGIATAVVGGALSWYLLLTPGSWTLTGSTGYALIGYIAVVIVILLTSQMYRVSEQNRIALVMKEAENQTLFAREMSHRLKNAMAVVQAMANQTFTRGNPDLVKFDGRLLALAQAHNLLNEHIRQPSADVRELVELAIAPFEDGAGRFTLTGPAATIPDQQVISLALALHELGTNAVKYGALGGSKGSVSIQWELVEAKLRLVWQERDGPPVNEPSSTGFGTRLLRRTAMGADLQFHPDGLRCVISQKV